MSETLSPLKTKALLLARAAVIALAGLWVFWPALRGGWIWDDFVEVAQNPVLRDPGGLRKIWCTSLTTDYFPLKTTWQWVEWHLWGGQVLGYHLVNLGLHVLSALLLWRLLRKLGLRHAWIGGLLFVVHPLTVESVAWISEFKNTLSLPLLLGAMIAWVAWDEERDGLVAPKPGQDGRAARPDSTGNQSGTRTGGPPVPTYVLSLALFLAALLSKTSVVMFPVVILIFCWWRRGRVSRRDLLASAPFFAVSLVLGLVTMWFQAHRAITTQDLINAGFWARCAGAGQAVAFYFWKCVIPTGLVPNYPPWSFNPPTPAQFLPWLALAAVFGWLWMKNASARRRRAEGGAMPRHVLFGLGFFLVNLLPVLGFIPMAYSRIAWVADHFVYLPLLGIIGLAVAVLETRFFSRRWVLGLSGAVVGAALAWQSHSYARVFQSDETFWSYTLEHNPESWMAQNDLAMGLTQRHRVPEAIKLYEAALRLKPDFAEAHVNLGNALWLSDRLEEAMGQYRIALQLQPGYLEARYDLANTLLQSKQFSAAVEQYEEIWRAKPDFYETRASLSLSLYQWGNSLANSGRLDEAVACYERALQLRPGYPEAHANLGLALANTGRLPEAISELKEALRLQPRYAEAHAYLGFTLAKSGQWEEAIAQYERALQLKPGDADVHYNLALALQQAGRPEEAKIHFAEAARLGDAH